MPGLDLGGFKAAAMGMASVIRESHADDMTLIAEGDEVVARFTYRLTLTRGKQLSARNLSYFRLANGRIVENEPMTSPDVFAEIAALMTPPSAS
jgi:ketosteroid isomerase-like protein